LNDFKAISIGKIKVNDDESWVYLCNLGKRFCARGSFEYMKATSLLERFSDATSHDRMIINDHGDN
jgi:hypothetical protein